jgi:hypothetical protein
MDYYANVDAAVLNRNRLRNSSESGVADGGMGEGEKPLLNKDF